MVSLIAAALLPVIGVLVAPTAAHAAESRVICNHDWVRVRAAATTSSRELGRLTRGTQVDGTQQGTWFHMTDGRFIAAYYTCAGSASQNAPAAPVAQAAPVAPVLSSGASHTVCRTPWVRVRAQATTASKELRRLNANAAMSGTIQGSWLHLDGGAGFVAAYYACPADTAPGAPPAPQILSAPAPAPEPAATSGAPLLLQPTGTQGSPTSPFGQRYHPILRTWRLHNGIDIGNRAGEPILAAEGGTVSTVARDSSAGLYVKIDHGSVAGTPRVGTGYLHMNKAVVSPGQWVARGQVIGYVGNTGLSTKPHLHFIVYESGNPVNPEKYLGPLASLR